MSVARIGVQLFTLRNEMEANPVATLRKAASIGYEGVEFAGYFGLPADKLRDLLQELNLKAIGSHVGLDRLRHNLDEEIAYLKTIGGEYLVCPYLSPEERSSEEQPWRELFSFLQETGLQVRNSGLQFAYHNHDFEFQTQVDGKAAFDALFASTSPEAVKVELDACWVKFAGRDPIRCVRDYSGRLPLVHMKDFTVDEDGKMLTLELEKGVMPLREIIDASAKAGAEWLIVEQDNCQNPPLESVAASFNWLISALSKSNIRKETYL